MMKEEAIRESAKEINEIRKMLMLKTIEIARQAEQLFQSQIYGLYIDGEKLLDQKNGLYVYLEDLIRMYEIKGKRITQKEFENLCLRTMDFEKMKDFSINGAKRKINDEQIRNIVYEHDKDMEKKI